jgi:hypothetical protein
MKRIIAIALFALASLVTVGNASAQSQIRATIPFDFTAGRAVLPAGTYTISSGNRIAVVIQNGTQHATVLRSTIADEDPSMKNRLVFNKYGDQYFLREILCPSSHLNLELPATKMEENARTHRASLDQDKQNEDKQVLVALNQ